MLEEDARNPFKELKHEEYLELVASIKKHGILIPLIVFQHDDRTYRVISGRNRLKAARELEIPMVPCLKISVADVEAAFETEIYRRHLTPTEKEKFKKKLEDVCKKIIEMEIENRLPEDLLREYQDGKLKIEDALRFLKFGYEALKFNIRYQEEKGKDGEEKETSGKEKIDVSSKLSEEEKETLKKEGIDLGSDQALDLIKQKSIDLDKEVKEKKEEVEKAKKKLGKALTESEKKEFQEKIKSLEKDILNIDSVNDKLRGMIKKLEEEKNAAIEQMEEKERYVESQRIQLKGEKVAWDEAEREMLFNMIQRRLKIFLEEITIMKKEVNRDLTQKAISSINEMVKKIKLELDRFLSHIQKLDHPKYDNVIKMEDLRT